MPKKRRDTLEKSGEHNPFTPLSTEYHNLHSRTLEEFPEGPYGSPLQGLLGKQSGWDTGEEVNPIFSYENEQLHEAATRPYPQADPLRKNPEGHPE
ncbi:hypothetical protein J2S00_002285 [Caldalkalibacillus uzonensis]|uniref:Cytosolic protein n=1 Tax=Caldalkalibacillus uzonensis TaxID=353224 RepID=A0ABU0CWS9_9BACI|nr:hypothetical protein [Caldalkalibacillus uzonensis]MDQ0339497.1 hypothetical protein [Caldalkalibacillus uzonensis]